MPEFVQRLDLFRIDKRDLTPTNQGGIRVKARIARTGILLYRNEDGSTRRELRLPEDVFDDAALKSFDNATVTERHPGGLITPLNWRQNAIGNLDGTPKRDGDFVAADVLIQHGDAVRKVESDDPNTQLRELSCGYQCKVDMTPGEHPKYGRYDARQFQITGNHVGIGPSGWGRSGSDVSLRFDGDAIAVAEEVMDSGSYVRSMAATKTKTPGTTTSTAGTATEDADELAAARGRIAALEADVARLTEETHTDEAEEAARQEREDARVAERTELVTAAATHLDAKWSPKGKTDDQVRREVLAKIEPKLTLPDAKTDGAAAWVRGAFDVAVARAVKATGAIGKLRLASPAGGRGDAFISRGRVVPGETKPKADGTEDVVESDNIIADAADDQLTKRKNAWKTPPKKDRK